MISSLFSESCIQISALRRSFIILAFCILASTHTVKFTGEETAASEVNGAAFCTIVQKWVCSFTHVSHSGDVGEWLAWVTTHIQPFIIFILPGVKEQRSREAMEHSPAWLL